MLERHFKGATPTQPSVRGVLHHHREAWKAAWVEQYTINKLCNSCRISFLHSSLTQEPRVFPFYSSGSARSQALLEVDKLLRKGGVEIIHDRVPAFYRRLFLVERLMVGEVETCHQSVSTQHLSGPYGVNDGDCHVSPGHHLKRRLHFLDRSEGCVLSHPHPSRVKNIPAFHGKQEDPSVQSSVLGLFTAPQVFTRVFSIVSEWVHVRGGLPLWYLNDWLVIASVPLLLEHCHLLLRYGFKVLAEKASSGGFGMSHFFFLQMDLWVGNDSIRSVGMRTGQAHRHFWD